MGIDANERIRKPNMDKMKGPRIWFPLDVLQGSAYASVSTTAKALLLDLAAQLRAKHGKIYNNGDLTTAMKVLSKRGWKNDKTIRNAAAELEKAHLIVKTRQGHLPNTCNLYAVTWLELNENRKLDITKRGFPYKAYILSDPLTEFKKKLIGNY
ncbi:MAG: hypothetical protein ACSHWN_07050 [Methylophilaceae bacterium]